MLTEKNYKIKDVYGKEYKVTFIYGNLPSSTVAKELASLCNLSNEKNKSEQSREHKGDKLVI